jgi:RimJ/RimL family protein N-acetyltransferase
LRLLPENRHISVFPAMDIRFLDPSHLTAYRDLRLAGLRESPTAFGSSFAEEAALPSVEFEARLRPPNRPHNGILGALVDDGRLVGVLGFAREYRVKRPHVALAWGMYVSPEFRGQGIGAALLDEAIAHARKVGGIRQLALAVTASNVAAVSLYRSRGFERFGLERDALWVDGAYYDEEHMVLFLKETS